MNLELKNLSIQLGDQTLVQGLNLAVGPGQVATLMGPSGSGKSTVLAFIAGFLDPCFTASGSVHIDARLLNPLPPEQRGAGLVFQDDLLFPHMTVAENLGFGLKKRSGERWPARRKRIEAALEAGGLRDYGPRRPKTLSGGQRARVSLLRSLLAEPDVLLLDEPFSKLDAALRASFRNFVFDQVRARGIPALMVTHDIADTKGAGGLVLDLAGFQA